MPTQRDEDTSPEGIGAYRANPRGLELEVGEVVLGRYRLERRLGSGAFHDVYVGTDIRLGRQVAVRLRPPTMDVRAKAIERETLALSRLSHLGIISLLDSEGPVTVTEFVPGRTLRELMKERPADGWSELLWVIRDVANAMAYAHSKGVIHRDIKPDTILVGRDGDRPFAKVIDFGLSLSTNERTDEPDAILGTPRYMSPDAFRGEGSRPESDVYSLGVVLYELITGRPPVDAKNMAELVRLKLGKPIISIPDDVPGPLSSLLREMLSFEPALRPTMAEVADRIDDVQHRRDPSRAREATAVSPAGVPLAVGLGAIVMAIADTVGGVLTGGQGFVLGVGVGLLLVLLAGIVDAARAQ